MKYDINKSLVYITQANDNADSFAREPKYADRGRALKAFLERLNAEGIRWAVGCSFAMYGMGITDDFHDFDIIVCERDFARVIEIMKELGAEFHIECDSQKKDVFCSHGFATATLPRNAEFDIIADFGIRTFGSYYQYYLEDEHIDYFKANGMIIPLVPAEPLFVLYHFMVAWQPGRKFKVDRLREYLAAGNVRHPEILEDALRFDLPWRIRNDIEQLL
ncbi:MAG: hypothetical protein IJS47_04320 [Clostridia bacterium]|nr:hypothetical protein [Clostridia bacterium]